MSVNQFFDVVAIVVGLLFVLVVVWTLMFPGSSTDDDRTFRTR